MHLWRFRPRRLFCDGIVVVAARGVMMRLDLRGRRGITSDHRLLSLPATVRLEGAEVEAEKEEEVEGER